MNEIVLTEIFLWHRPRSYLFTTIVTKDTTQRKIGIYLFKFDHVIFLATLVLFLSPKYNYPFPLL